MKKHFLLIVGIVLVALAVSFALIVRTAASTSSTKVIDLTSLRLEIADTDALRAHGLSDRVSLDGDAGMLFLFEKPGIYPFWMKDMHFPLDMVWINDDRVVEVTTLPPPQAEAVVPPTHIPTHVADTVLEINAGKAKELGIQPGVRVMLP